MGTLELLNKSEDDLRVWTLAQSSSTLQETFDEIWQQIRSGHLYAGQPSSVVSQRGVSLARICLQIASCSANDRLLVQASRMLAYSLTANEQYEESLPYHERSIAGLEALGDMQQAARA